MPQSLQLPQLVVTPPSREPTPQLHITPADWERYPGITFSLPSPSPSPSSSQRDATRRRRSRLPPYRPSPPPVRPLDLPAPVPVHPSADRWFVSGRARRSGAGWVPCPSEGGSPIHDAAEDAYLACFGEVPYSAGDVVGEKAPSYDEHDDDKIIEYPADEKEEKSMDSEKSYAAFTTAYADIVPQYVDSWTLRSVSRKDGRRPPPVRPLDLPGSRVRTEREGKDEKGETREVRHVERREAKGLRKGWWALPRRR